MKKLSPSALRDHMRALGQVRSEAKASAARLNGAKGGRPKKLAQVVKNHA